MGGQPRPRVKLSPVEQIGIVVKDVDKTVEYYNSTFGLGPFHIREVELKGFTYRDQLCDCRLKVAFTRSGPVEIELIQVLEGETPHTDFLRERGEGLQHLRFSVNDFPSAVPKLAKEGIKPVWHRGAPVFAYLDTDKIGGVMFELLQEGIVRREEDE